MNPLQAKYLVFEVMFGPGKLGIKMKSRRLCLSENEEKTDVVYLENVPDEDITIVGPGKRVPLLRREPVILAVNGKSVTGMSLKQVVQILGDAVRPLTLRLQIGTAPATTATNLYSSIRMSSGDLSPLAEVPGSDSSSDSPVVEKEEIIPSSPLELSLDDSILSPVSSLRRSLSPRNLSPQDMEGRVVRRYYRERNYRVSSAESEVQEEPSGDSHEDETEEKQAVFVEHMRSFFLLEMCELFDGYEEYIRSCYRDDSLVGVEEGVDPDEVFNTKAFLKHVDEDSKPFLKSVCRTQLFSHFIHDAYEYDDDYEVRVFTEAMKLKHEMGDVFEPYIISALSPEHWKKHEVNVTPCDLRGLPEG